ncbi:tensin [Drosophila guanche]|uniref:Blast:Tensin-3 n=1 Tax=Drosophila guanche TaxID=7266 RepID=A0A3B0K8X6_DROGU|nr:tensin [Drosophila guanche]SPP84560.1 blast:Tensin-3 [Drosophila guanche]
MRSPYEDSAAVSTDHKYQYSSANHNNNNYYKNYNVNGNGNGNGTLNGNGNGIPYHARENSLPFSYGMAKTSTPLRKTPTPTRADSFLDFDFGSHKNSSNTNNNNTNDMIKPQPRLTSPLLVRKTLGNGTNGTASSTNTIANTYHYRSGSTTPTPLRDDFEQLLRERRDKVFSEYRERDGRERVPPTPPQRHYYPSPNGQGNGYNGNGYRSSHSNGQASKYNYDFEFNLHLDDMNTERSSLPAPAPYHTRTIQFEDQRHEHRHELGGGLSDQDVPDGVVNRRLASTAVERNYHTINSMERPPLEATYKRQLEPQLQLGAVYGQSNLETLTRTRREVSTATVRSTSPLPSTSTSPSSPIYATSTKRVNNPNTNGFGYGQTTPSPTSRPETPAFPVTPRTPFGGTVGTTLTQLGAESIYQMAPRQQQQQQQQQRLSSPQELPLSPMEVAADSVRFARSSAKFWYKPNLSREDAIALLASAQPGTFLVRDSTTYKNAYGLVVRVAQPPAGSQELVRHFLIEPTREGVRLKGCENEPVFTSLSALVFEHSINRLALPCLLRLPEEDIVPGLVATPAQQHLLTHGAATNVLWLYSCDTESLTGNEAIRKAIRLMYAQQKLPEPTEVHFKVTSQGITLTDNTRKKFFRKHYTADVISHCAIDPESRMWTGEGQTEKKTIFAFVARRSHSSKDNQCHVFCDLSVSQPAAAIVSFANRTLPTEKLRNYVL